MFRFATPEYFYLLILVPVLIGVYWYSVRVRRRALERFGDPETQPILSMLDTDLMDIFQACVNGTLDQVDIRWKEGAACCIVLASGGYPVQYQSGYPISGLEEAGKLATVFHAGTKGDGNGRILTAGGRVLGVTAVGGSLEEAIETAYAACKPIAFQDMHFRTDIGKV